MLPWVQLYANDEKRFFQDFAAAFTKLTELGVDFTSEVEFAMKPEKSALQNPKR